MSKALIIGVAGQDGSYLAELLLEKGYEVHGIVRQLSPDRTARIAHLRDARLFLHQADLADTASMRRIIDEVEPAEVYNLAGQSNRAVSFDEPSASEVDAVAAIRLFECVRAHMSRTGNAVRIYQAGSAEMFAPSNVPKNEQARFFPRSPYAASKLAVHWFGVGYRESYGMFICNGILFNHESPRRGESFVTRKITLGVARIKHGLQSDLVLGNLEAIRDWGFAGDYARAMWAMLQHSSPDDYVIATQEPHSVAEFCEAAFTRAGLDWRQYVRTDDRFLRQAEFDYSVGDPTKAQQVLGWRPSLRFDELVGMMVDADLALTAG